MRRLDAEAVSSLWLYDDVRADFERAFSHYVACRLTLENLSVKVDGDTARVVGHEALEFTTADGRTQSAPPELATYLLKRTPNGWRIVEHRH